MSLQPQHFFFRQPIACLSARAVVSHAFSKASFRRCGISNLNGIFTSKPTRLRQRGIVFLYAVGFSGAFVGAYYILVNGPTRSAPSSSTAQLAPTHFTPLTLTKAVHCTPYTKLITLSLPPNLITNGTEQQISPIFSFYVKDSDIQVERAYTPLEGIDAQGQMHFWIKRYQAGEVSRWLHERKVGEQIEVRGPVQNWEWRDGEWDQIVMISGGTGITPFYQLLYSVFSLVSEKGLPRTRFTLLHSSPTPSDLPPPALMDRLRSYAQSYPESFSLRLFVDAANPKSPWYPSQNLTIGRIGKKVLDQTVRSSTLDGKPWWKRFWTPSRLNSFEGKTLFLICGPEPMIAAIAGPRARNLTQGHVGGILGEMGFQSHHVWKL